MKLESLISLFCRFSNQIIEETVTKTAAKLSASVMSQG